MTAHRYSLDEIDSLALPRVIVLCERLFGAVQVRGSQIWMLSPTRSDPNWTSFSFNTRSGVWKDFGGALGGGKGCLSLVAATLGRGSDAPDYTRAIPWLKDFLGLSSSGEARGGVFAKKIDLERLKRETAQREAESKAHAARQRKAALGLWLAAKPLDGSDPASRYLRARGLDVRALAGGIPRALRFHPCVYAADPDPLFRGPYPALLGAIARHGDGVIAVHRTYLTADHRVAPGEARGSVFAHWRKCTWANCKTGKQVKGSYAGGYIALSRGSSGLSLREAAKHAEKGEAHEMEWPAVHEGIEDALTTALVKPELRCLAAVSIANIGDLVLPPQVKGVYIVKQNDTKQVTISQFERQMDRLAERGIEPAIVEIPAQFKDVNDALLGRARASASAKEKEIAA